MNSNQVTIDGQSGTIQADGWVRMGSDDRVNVLFYRKSVLDRVKSVEAGRPVHIAMDYVRIQQPGEKDYADRPVDDDRSVIARWPRHWDAYQKGRAAAPDGTPVEMLFPQNPEIAANLHTLAVHTIEQLATLTAHGMQTIGMGATQWQQKAKQFLAAANGGAGMHRLAEQNAKLLSQLETQANQIASLRTQLDRLAALQSGVPSAMVPERLPTVAQQHASRSLHGDYRPNQGVSAGYIDSDADIAASNAGGGSFQQPDEFGQSDVSETGEEAPPMSEVDPPVVRKGWPKGKPRGPRKHA